jgi:hypothetical protein
MSLKDVKLVGTTISDGSATVTATSAVLGYLVAVDWIDGDLTDGVDAVLSITKTPSGVDHTLLTLTNANSDAIYYPRRVFDTTAGAAATALYDRFIIDGVLTLAITSGGDANTGGCIVYYDTE